VSLVERFRMSSRNLDCLALETEGIALLSDVGNHSTNATSHPITLYFYVESVLCLFVQVNALLPSNMFLLVVRGLLNHKLPTVRRKVMELLNTRLQHQGSFFSSCNRETLYSLLTPLLSVMGSIGSDTVKPDLETNQQVAMLSVKLLARHLAPENPSQFKQVKCCSVSWNKYVREFIKT